MIYRSHPEHAHIALRCSQSVSRPRPRSSNAALRRRAVRAPRASATACASSAQNRRTRCSAPRRTRRACPSSRSRGSTRGWRSMRSRSVPRGCSSRTSNRDASGPAGAEVVARVRGRMRTGAYIVRLRTSGWKSGQREAGASAYCALHSRFLPSPIGICLCMRARYAHTLKATGCGARPRDMAGCAQGFRACVRGAARCGLAEKTRKGA
jgi:hypothetical protein